MGESSRLPHCCCCFVLMLVLLFEWMDECNTQKRTKMLSLAQVYTQLTHLHVNMYNSLASTTGGPAATI